ncbi:lipopolysaccharide biosynthesis protein [Cohnella sp.]|uniref:lipopolysaccharide biosynthesis protein n=1 Tax=Cohnella sp. TaxID=1883426 RepID=UPI003567B595
MASGRTVGAFSSSIFASIRGKSLFTETVKTMGISIGIMFVNLLTGILTARSLGPEGRGVQTALILWPQFLAFATTLGIHSALLYHMKKSKEEEADLYYSSLFLSMAAGAASVVIGIVFIPHWLGSESESIVSTAQWFMFATPFMLLYFMQNALFRGRDEFRAFNRMRYLVPLLSLLMLTALIAADRLTPYTSGLAYLAPYVPVTIYAVCKSIRLYRLSLRRIRSAGRKIVSYGISAYGIDLLGNLILYIDQIILIGLLAPGPLGLYVVAVSLSRMLNVFSSSIIMVLFPKLSGLEAKEAALLCLRVFKLATIGALACTGVLMLAAPVFINLLYGSLFLDSIPVFSLLVLEVVLGGSAMVLAQAFMAQGSPIVATISQAIGIVLVVPLMYALVPAYGLTGAGMALLIPAAVRLLYVAYMFQRRFKLGLKAFAIGKNDLLWVKSLRSRRSPAAANDSSTS